MNTSTKMLNAMVANPRDWQIVQLQTVAKQHGISWRHDGSSYCIFITEDGHTLPVPAHRPIKPIYVKKFVALVKEAQRV
ncbi:MAG: type II toxin-antitoxin system HicA family toxin [Methylococcales bacterium]